MEFEKSFMRLENSGQWCIIHRVEEFSIIIFYSYFKKLFLLLAASESNKITHLATVNCYVSSFVAFSMQIDVLLEARRKAARTNGKQVK
jgi:hypothetical protein